MPHRVTARRLSLSCISGGCIVRFQYFHLSLSLENIPVAIVILGHTHRNFHKRAAAENEPGAKASNGPCAGAGVSRGRSTESNEPENSTGRTHNSGRAELGRQTRPSVVLSRSDEAESAELRAAIIVAEKECCVIPQGLPGTAVCGPACTVVWEPGGAKPSRRPDWARNAYEISFHHLIPAFTTASGSMACNAHAALDAVGQ